ncbi:MAG: rhodanese-like domain-containing protein [Gemmatimonadota bacterium]|nr:rhodanese-like domain-containing protein [Gemmatimonadota bacterium]
MKEQIEHYENKLKYEIDSYDVFEALNDGGAVIVVDARSPEAYAERHIPGAISLPHRAMDEKTTSRLDKDALHVTYCDGIGCNASTKGALKLARLGFSVKELMGGLDWWIRDGYATEGLHATGGKAPVCGC